jgi:hypothetical protein
MDPSLMPSDMVVEALEAFERAHDHRHQHNQEQRLPRVELADSPGGGPRVASLAERISDVLAEHRETD